MAVSGQIFGKKRDIWDLYKFIPLLSCLLTLLAFLFHASDLNCRVCLVQLGDVQSHICSSLALGGTVFCTISHKSAHIWKLIQHVQWVSQQSAIWEPVLALHHPWWEWRTSGQILQGGGPFWHPYFSWNTWKGSAWDVSFSSSAHTSRRWRMCFLFI